MGGLVAFVKRPKDHLEMSEKPFAAVAALLILAASPVAASEVRCWTNATREVHCDDGTRAHTFAGTTTVKRPGQRDLRCSRGPTGVSCNDR